MDRALHISTIGFAKSKIKLEGGRGWICRGDSAIVESAEIYPAVFRPIVPTNRLPLTPRCVPESGFPVCGIARSSNGAQAG